MNKIIFAIMPWLFTGIGYKATAQDTPKLPEPAKETQEIIVRKKGEKDATVTIQFKDDKVLINGKPIIEFKDDEVTINNRTIKFKQLEKDFEGFGRDMERYGKEMELAFRGENFKEDRGRSANFLGVTTEKNDAGAIIEEVVKNSPADKAGLKKDDIINKINDAKINGPQQLSEIIGSMDPKKEIKVYIKRDGKDKVIKATLEIRKTMSRTFSFTSPNGNVKSLSIPRAPRAPGSQGAPARPGAPGAPSNLFPPEIYEFGIEDFNVDGYGNLNRGRKLGLKIQDLEEGSGVKVLEVEEGSTAATAGLKKDDIITEIGNVNVNNTDEAREQLQENSSKSTYIIAAKRNNTAMKFTIKIPKKLKTANL